MDLIVPRATLYILIFVCFLWNFCKKINGNLSVSASKSACVRARVVIVDSCLRVDSRFKVDSCLRVVYNLEKGGVTMKHVIYPNMPKKQLQDILLMIIKAYKVDDSYVLTSEYLQFEKSMLEADDMDTINKEIMNFGLILAKHKKKS